VVIPQSRKQQREELNLESFSGLQMMFDLSCRNNIHSTPAFTGAYNKLAAEADICIFGHPYLFGLGKKTRNGQLLVYDAVDVELVVKAPYYQRSDHFEELIELVRQAEYEACERADMIFTTSELDRQTLSRLYSVGTDKIHVVPNTVDTREFVPIRRDEIHVQKRKMGLSGRTALFSGSQHPPNIQAVDFIVESLSFLHQDWQFLFTGSISEYVRQRWGSVRNIRALGVLSADEKTRVYRATDVAINPILYGSGTNLKMLVYMAAGLPIVTSLEGARGLDVENEEHALVCDLKSFDRGMMRLFSDPALCDKLTRNARKLVESRYDSTKVAAYVASLLSPNQARTVQADG
jgi:glycosyltransferase involved in cell wall biosynthesis